MLNQILTLIFYILLAGLIILVLNKYFSGARYRGLKPNLWGKVAVITGGNTGIGKETALALAQQGCKVIIGARDAQKSKKTVEECNKLLGQPMINQYTLDLSDLESIRNFVLKISQQKIDFLINNAGVMALPQRTLTKSGFQMQYGVNHLGHFYLTHLLWPKLRKSNFFRIINVSSMAHKRQLGFFKNTTLHLQDINFEKTKYSPTLAYARSKLYNNLFTHALAERIDINKGIVVSLHPGVVRSQLVRYMVTGWFQKILKFFYPIYTIFTKSAQEGAQTTLTMLYISEDKLQNGGYYSECRLAKENKLVTKQNWDKLWDISQKDLNVKFKLN